MKIVIPKYAMNQDLNDYQKVLMALLLIFVRLNDNDYETEFIMHSADVKKITNNYSDIFKETCKNRQKLLQVINATQYDSYNWGLSLPQDKIIVATRGIDKGNIIEDFDEIQDDRAIRIWYYLLGKMQNENIIEDNYGLFPHTEVREKMLPLIKKQALFK